MVYFVSVFLVQLRITNVIVVNTKEFVIKESFVTDVVLKLQKRKLDVNAWDTSNWLFQLHISGIFAHFQTRLAIC